MILTKEDNTFDTGSVVINNAGSFVEVANFKLNNEGTIESGFRTALIQLFAIGAALTGLKFTRTVQDNGDHVDWMIDTDFNTANSDFPSIQPLNIHNLGSGSSGLIKLGHVENIEEIKVWAKGTGNIRLVGNFL